MNIKKVIVGNNSKLSQKGAFWNMCASGLNAGMSAVLSMVVIRIMGEGSISHTFATAFSLAQMLLTIGYFDMRAYQVTDLKNPTPFTYYFTSRIITCGAMIAFSILYIFMNDYTAYEAIMIFLMCVFKMLDAFEDVMGGLFQKNGRLDIGGKLQSIRIVLCLVTFTAALFISKDLILTSAITVISGVILVIILNFPIVPLYDKLKVTFHFKILKALFIACMPMFTGSFLMMYISQAPRDAIYNYTGNEFQTAYSVLFLPSSVVNLLSNFVFQPLLLPLADRWEKRDYKTFSKLVRTLLLLLLALTGIAVIGAYLLGIPILSIIYALDLSTYKSALVVLMQGGGIGAAGTLIYYCTTVIRCQKYLLVGHILSAVAAFILSPIFVRSNGILGASVAYTSAILIRFICFFIIFIICYRSEKRKHGN